MAYKQIFNPLSGQFDIVLATPVTETDGGTNQSTYTTGDTLYASASNTLSKLSIGSTGDVLTVAGGVPTWAPGGSAGTPIVARASSNAGQVISAATFTIIDFGNITYDPDSTITTGASWKFTVPTGGAGKYHVSGYLVFDAQTYVTNNAGILSLYKNGSVYAQLGSNDPQAGNTYALPIGGSDTIDLADGDYIDLRVYNTQGATIDANDGLCHVAIERVVQSVQAVSTRNVAIYQYDTSNGHGSTDTKIRLFTNLTQSSDSSSLLTVANTSTNGLTITANRACTVSIMYNDILSLTANIGITKNSAQLTTTIASVTLSTRLIIGATVSGGVCGCVSVTDRAAANDIYRPHYDGTADNGVNTDQCGIYIFAEEIT